MSIKSQAGSIVGGIGSFFSSILGAVGRFFDSLFQAELHIVDNITHIVGKFDELKASIQRETEMIRNFDFDPRWRTRVISVPAAIVQTQTLVGMIYTDWSARMEKLRDPIHALKLIFSAEAIPPDPGHEVSGFAKSAVKIDEVATMIKELADAMDQIVEIAAFFEELTRQIETLDALFLFQGNKQIQVDGLSRERQGKLHGKKA